MTLPPLYAEGLLQHARQGFLKLCVYKLGLIEAIVKDAIRKVERDDPEAVKATLRHALAVAQWELRPPNRTPE